MFSGGAAMRGIVAGLSLCVDACSVERNDGSVRSSLKGRQDLGLARLEAEAVGGGLWVVGTKFDLGKVSAQPSLPPVYQSLGGS